MKVHKTKDGYTVVERQETVVVILDPAGKVLDRFLTVADAKATLTSAVADDKASKARRSTAGPAALAQMFPLGR